VTTQASLVAQMVEALALAPSYGEHSFAP